MVDAGNHAKINSRQSALVLYQVKSSQVAFNKQESRAAARKPRDAASVLFR